MTPPPVRQLTRAAPPPTPLLLSVPVSEWNIAIQEQEQPRNPKYKSHTWPKRYPDIWKITDIVHKHWLHAKFEVVMDKKTGTKASRMKETLTSWILQTRVLLPVSQITDTVLKQQFPSEKNLYVLPISYLAQYGEMNYRIDRGVSEGHKHESTKNDILRLFTILALSNNRDLLISLGAGKAFNRSELDGPLQWKEQIFYVLSVQFSDPNLSLQPPERAMFLKSFADMNPNDLTTISRERDNIFLMKLYTKTMVEYNHAMINWKAGTGGGSGRPENYADWEQRDEECFTTYGFKVKERYVEKDHLAWIYMLDKNAGYPFNSSNDPAPDETVREDSNTGGSGTMKGKKGTHIGEAVAQFGKDFQETMQKGLKEMTKVVSVAETTSGRIGNRDDVDDRVDKTLLRIDNISARIESVERLIEGGKNVQRHAKRLRILEKTLNSAYAALDGPSDDDDDDDDDDSSDDEDL